MTVAPEVELANDVGMPALGLGTFPMDDREAEVSVATAIEVGYRLIDTAEDYGNEVGVGRGIRASGIDRDEVFVTTKFNQQWHGYAEAQQAFANSAERLGLDHIDLLLIHWPMPGRDRYVDAWRGMIELLEDGRVRAIGVSNFKPAHLDRVIEATGVVPHVNQIELSPRVARDEERRYHAAHGIVTESWAPIGKAGDLLDEAPVAAAAEAHDRTPAQIVLRWHVQQGLVAIPKTQKPERMRENLDVFGFALTDTEMDAISALDRGRLSLDPDSFGH